MNIFERFLLSREVTLKEGEITLDRQRIAMFPVGLVGECALAPEQGSEQARILYESMKKGQIEFSRAIGKEYLFDSKTFLDRWIKYCEFAGWGIVTYQLVEKDGRHGFLYVKNLPMHQYLRSKGINKPSDVLFEGLIAGSISGTFRIDVDVIETKCICSGNDVCVYYWGPKKDLKEKFPGEMQKRFGDWE